MSNDSVILFKKTHVGIAARCNICTVLAHLRYDGTRSVGQRCPIIQRRRNTCRAFTLLRGRQQHTGINFLWSKLPSCTTASSDCQDSYLQDTAMGNFDVKQKCRLQLLACRVFTTSWHKNRCRKSQALAVDRLFARKPALIPRGELRQKFYFAFAHSRVSHLKQSCKRTGMSGRMQDCFCRTITFHRALFTWTGSDVFLYLQNTVTGCRKQTSLGCE